MDPKYKFPNQETVVDDNGAEVSPLDDDYEFWKTENERLTNPLSDDYCKYYNE